MVVTGPSLSFSWGWPLLSTPAKTAHCFGCCKTWRVSEKRGINTKCGLAPAKTTLFGPRPGSIPTTCQTSNSCPVARKQSAASEVDSIKHPPQPGPCAKTCQTVGYSLATGESWWSAGRRAETRFKSPSWLADAVSFLLALLLLTWGLLHHPHATDRPRHPGVTQAP